MKHSILCVDDEVDNVEALERLFRRKYKVLKATSGAEGLEILKKEQVALIISDQRMPQMTGVEFLEKSLKTHPEAVRILLTGYTDIDSVISAINSGQIYRYVTKPWDPNDLQTAVDRAIERYQLNQELKSKNVALKEALDELKSLDEAKNHFMILINHELKTPLTVLLSFQQLLKDTPLSEEQAMYLKRIETSSARLQSLIDDVLQLVSAETGVLKVDIKKTSPEKILHALPPQLMEKATEKEQIINFDYDENSLKADPRVMEQVLTRLIENAVKFGNKQSEILVRVHPSTDGKTRFQVENEGKSISPAMIQKVLKPFTLDENIMNHTKGTGLGLSLCQALLKTHSSELHIESSGDRVSVSFDV
jgi:signal transduction histidine kinase